MTQAISPFLDVCCIACCTDLDNTALKAFDTGGREDRSEGENENENENEEAELPAAGPIWAIPHSG
jgi:hypothetical protein